MEAPGRMSCKPFRKLQVVALFSIFAIAIAQHKITSAGKPLHPAPSKTLHPQNPHLSACAYLDNSVLSCCYGGQPFESQASTLCYSTGGDGDFVSFAPSTVNSLYSDCLQYYISANTGELSRYVLYTGANGDPITTPCQVATSLLGSNTPETYSYQEDDPTQHPQGVVATDSAGKNQPSSTASTSSSPVSTTGAASQGKAASTKPSLVTNNHGIALKMILASIALGTFGMAVLL